MSKTRRNSEIRYRAFAVTLYCSLGVLACAVLGRLQNRFVLENQSAQTITEVQVEVCKRTYIVRNVRPGGKAWVTITVDRDSGYSVLVKEQDGSKIVASNLGYVTNGAYSLRDRIVISAKRDIDLCETGDWPWPLS
jgi:hypothetical protein